MPSQATVIAGGPATGKTATLVEQTKAMLHAGLPARSIAVITANAANAERVRAALATPPDLFVGTPTTLALDILHTANLAAGYSLHPYRYAYRQLRNQAEDLDRDTITDITRALTGVIEPETDLDRTGLAEYRRYRENQARQRVRLPGDLIAAAAEAFQAAAPARPGLRHIRHILADDIHLYSTAEAALVQAARHPEGVFLLTHQPDADGENLDLLLGGQPPPETYQLEEPCQAATQVMEADSAAEAAGMAIDMAVDIHRKAPAPWRDIAVICPGNIGYQELIAACQARRIVCRRSTQAAPTPHPTAEAIIGTVALALNPYDETALGMAAGDHTHLGYAIVQEIAAIAEATGTDLPAAARLAFQQISPATSVGIGLGYVSRAVPEIRRLLDQPGYTVESLFRIAYRLRSRTRVETHLPLPLDVARLFAAAAAYQATDGEPLRQRAARFLESLVLNETAGLASSSQLPPHQTRNALNLVAAESCASLRWPYVIVLYPPDGYEPEIADTAASRADRQLIIIKATPE